MFIGVSLAQHMQTVETKEIEFLKPPKQIASFWSKALLTEREKETYSFSMVPTNCRYFYIEEHYHRQAVPLAL